MEKPAGSSIYFHFYCQENADQISKSAFSKIYFFSRMINQSFACLMAACAAASLAIGTRNGEQDT